MRLVVFGGGGQLGRELAAATACLAGTELVRLTREEVDIADSESVGKALATSTPQVVVNAAAYIKVDLAEANAEAAWSANHQGSKVLAENCQRRAIPLIHLSTDYVFDGLKTTAYEPDDPVAPLGVYGASKEAGERAVRAACERHVILRTAWVHGRYGSNFLKTILRLCRERRELRIVGDQVGNPTATPDLARAVLTAARQVVGSQTAWGTYHFAGKGDATWHDLAQEIATAQAKITGKKPIVHRITTAEYPTPALRPANSRLSSRRFESAFGMSHKPWQEWIAPLVEAVLTDEKKVTR